MTPLEQFKDWLRQAGIEFTEERFRAVHVTYEDTLTPTPRKTSVVQRRVTTADERESTMLTVERGYIGFVSQVTFGPDGDLVNVEAYE